MKLVSNSKKNEQKNEVLVPLENRPKVLHIKTLGKEVYLVISHSLKIEIMGHGKVRVTNKNLYTDIQLDTSIGKEERTRLFSHITQGILDKELENSVVVVEQKKSTEVISTEIINAIMITENELKIIQSTEVSSYEKATFNVKEVINKYFNVTYEIEVQNFRCAKLNL